MIGLIDVDSKIPNLALMKLSSFYKAMGEEVKLYSLPGCYKKKVTEFGKIEFEAASMKNECEKLFASTVFTRSSEVVRILEKVCEDKLSVGGTGCATPGKRLPEEVERSKPDYDLYSFTEIAKRMNGIGTAQHKERKALELVNSGHGFTSRGCVRACPFCMVPKCEGKFRQESTISDLVNPKSNVLSLHDNNLAADPLAIEKLKEIKERKIILDINQGIDIRLMHPELVDALSGIRHLRSIHYAWDLMKYESQVLEGIKLLSKEIKPYRQMCFMLVGFDTSFEEDMYRMRTLASLKVDPFCMIFDENINNDVRLKHFARWVNSRIYKTCPNFEEYLPWKKEKAKANLIGYEQLSFF